MNDLFRALVVHHAQFHKTLLTNWGADPGLDRAGSLVEGLVYDGLWLTKFPLLYTPTFGIHRLDGLHKNWQTGSFDAGEVVALRPLVDADMLRFVLLLKPHDLENRVELFFGGRAMNKPLWNYLVAWLEHASGLRARLAPRPGMFDTVFS